MEVSRRNAVTNKEAMATTALFKLDVAFKDTVEPLSEQLHNQDSQSRLLRSMVIAWLIRRQRI